MADSPTPELPDKKGSPGLVEKLLNDTKALKERAMEEV